MVATDLTADPADESDPLGSALMEIAASRSCGRTANASSAEDGATPTAIRTAVLAVLPAAEHPTPATLDRLAREYGLKDELDGAWAVRPLELVRERGRIMLVLEDTRQRAAGPIARGAHGGAELSAPRHRGRCGPDTSPPARPRPQGHQAGQYPGEPHDRRGQAHRFRYRFASAARAAGARAARSRSRARSPIWRPNRPDA